MFENVAALLECNLHRFWQASEEAANCGCKMLDNLNPVLKHPVSVAKRFFKFYLIRKWNVILNIC